MKLFALALCVTVAATNFTATPDEFDGKSWGKIELGVATDATIKKQYNTVRSTVRPEGLGLVRADGGTSSVLLQGRGSKALAIGFTHEGFAGTFADWSKDQKWEVLHLPTRFTDVSVAVNPERGQAALINDRDAILMLVMAKPANIQTMANSLNTNPAPVRDILAEFENSDRRIQLGRSSVSVTIRDLPDISRRSVERDAQYVIDDYRFPNYVSWRSSHAGTISVTLTLDYNTKRDETEIRASTSISGGNGWGTASATGSGAVTRGGRRADRRDVEDAVDDSLANAMRGLGAAAEKIAPANSDQLTRAEFIRVVNLAVK
ncbi:MAG: hypothetical protein JNJ45_12455 [Chthonomonas sp.]|nr:hypothetical protein [Chthonomonas sp.]